MRFEAYPIRVYPAWGREDDSSEPMMERIIKFTAVAAALSGGVAAAPVREENAL
jgi:hypothetical protein